MEKSPIVICPNCSSQETIGKVLTAQSNQNVIFTCHSCGYQLKNIKTSKG
ncbi:hypothetical protein [Metabacillus arenae]|uniref:Uncharacterized protein n=1 Tax=Metabacillus arenae TaxID=2771434 RepID=A0A926NHA9_9BACI|nr:hypothetical protein [Metabacillus arenae]MBD1381281.1 hypothetical protein [Metabacillus arenae]